MAEESFLTDLEAEFEEVVKETEEHVDDKTEDKAEDKVEDKAEEQQGGRAQQRIRQLVEDRNQLRNELEQTRQQQEAQAKAMLSLKEAVEKMASARAKEEAPAGPDFMEDPQGYIDSQAKQTKAQLEEIKRQAEEGNERAQMAMAQMQFKAAIQQDEATFMQANPDYYQALEHVRNVRQEELEELGLTAEEVAQTINREELQAAAIAANKGTSAAQYFYDRAKRLGFSGQSDDNLDEVDANAARLEAAQRAGSMGGSGIPENAQVDDPEAEAWAPIEDAFKELFGESLK